MFSWTAAWRRFRRLTALSINSREPTVELQAETRETRNPCALWTPLRLCESLCVCVCEWVKIICAHVLCFFLSLLLSDFPYPCLGYFRAAIVSCWRVTSCVDYFEAVGSCSVVLNRMATEEVLLLNTETNYWDLMISWDQPIFVSDCLFISIAANTSH